jgi:hypothetical protein
VAAATVVGATAAGTAEGVEVLLSTAWDLPPTEKELSYCFLAELRIVFKIYEARSNLN